MGCYSLRDVNADGGKLLLGNLASWERPDASAFGDPLAWDTEVFAGKNENFFDQPNKIDRTKVWAAFAGKVAAEIEDGVSDELARPVIGNVTATVDLVDLNAAACEQFVARKDVGSGCISAKREHGRVFQQHERVADRSGFARRNNFALNAQTFNI